MIGRKFRETMNKLNILLPLVLCLINFICICFTYRISPICTLMLLLCQISFFFSGTLYYFAHKKAMQKIFKDLLIYMDQMIDGYTIDEQETLEDTFISQVYHKLYKLYNILQSKQQRIEAERDKLQSFISDISHQIKTPLTNLNLVQETLVQQDISDSKKITYLNIQKKQLQKLNFLIHTLLKSSQLEKRKPNGITKADKEARKSDDLIKRDFTANKPLEKCITDMTEIKASDGKLYVSAIFDCYDLAVLGLAMDTNMKATLCEQTLDNACKAYPMLRGAILHSDRGTQYTSELYRKAINKYGILQSMNSAGGRCHDNARCESMWARFKEELLYGRYDTTSMTVEQLKTLIWRYFISYWNNRRICSANGGLPPMIKRQQYYDSLQEAA